MDREQYIKNLKDALKESFTQQQSNDILADYSEFFDAGIAEGKSESELCAEFGSPEKVAMELASSNLTEQKQEPSSLCLEIICILAVIANFLLLPFLAQNATLFPSAYIFLLPIALQAIIIVDNSHNRPMEIPRSIKYSHIMKNWFTGWKLYTIVLLISVAFAYFLSYGCVWKSPYGKRYFLYAAILVFLAFISLYDSIYPKKIESFPYLKRILIVCYLLVAALFVVLFILVNNAYLLATDNSSKAEFLNIFHIISIVCFIIITLSIFTGIMITIYAIHVNKKVKWLLFINSTFISLILNMTWLLSFKPNDFYREIFFSSRFAILQNGVSAALFLLFLLFLFMLGKLKAKRGYCYERANEKGYS